MGRKRLPRQPETPSLLKGAGPWHDDLEGLRLPARARSLIDDWSERPWTKTNSFVLIDSRLSLYTPRELDDAETELDRLVRAFGPVLNAAGKLAYARRRRIPGKVVMYETAQYLTDRNAF